MSACSTATCTPAGLHEMLIKAQHTAPTSWRRAGTAPRERERPAGHHTALCVGRIEVAVEAAVLRAPAERERPGQRVLSAAPGGDRRRRARPVGYKMLTEILVRGRWSAGRVPYRFETRGAGTSKAGFGRWQYLHHTARIFADVPEVARLWKFLMVGATGWGKPGAVVAVRRHRGCASLRGLDGRRGSFGGVELLAESNVHVARPPV